LSVCKAFVNRSRELADAVFDDPIQITGPHLDLSGVIDAHKQHVLRLKRQRRTIEEIAAYNLSRAHEAIGWIALELANRQNASLMVALSGAKEAFQEMAEADPSRPIPSELKRGFELLDELLNSSRPVNYGPLNDTTSTQGELAKQLLNVSFPDLLNPMKTDYIHFLHRITTMGLIKTTHCGVFRKTSVHIPGNPHLHFPLPSLVPKLMEEYASKFPAILPSTVNYDPIMVAAKTSYSFVRIHPYADGNGRVSRLLMNLVLWQHFPPVYLKADKKGRHRYIQALRRADRGNITPLACLIAMSLESVYERLLQSVAG
jgi:hypothetical protein